MSNSPLRSPEFEVIKFSSNSFLRLIRFFLRLFYFPIKCYLLQLRWRHHSDSRFLDINWKKYKFNRIALVNLLLKRFTNPNYLEIGCAADELFSSVPVLGKVGIDPLFGGTVREKSDSFFTHNTMIFDVVFIDGLHTYEQVRRDVVNSIHSAKPGSWICLHDMLPRNWIESHIPIITSGPWSGDVWKIALELCVTKGIEFKILKIDHGVGMIKVLDRKVILKDLSHLLAHKQFDYYYSNLAKLPIIEWEASQDWLIN